MPWAVRIHKGQFIDWLWMTVPIYHKNGSKRRRGRTAHFSHTWDWICFLMDLEYEWFCLVGASTGGTSSPVYVWLHRGLSCYSIRKPQVAQKLKLKAMSSKLESTVQWKKICQKGLEWQAGSAELVDGSFSSTFHWWQGKGTKWYFHNGLVGEWIFVVFWNCSTQ